MIKQLAHICLTADDLTATQQFYCDILGLTKKFDFIKNGSWYGLYLEAGNNTFIEVFIRDEEVNRERPLVKHLCLEVEDIESTIHRIRQKGWMVSDKKMGGDNTWQAWITDPNGVAIELQQYTSASSQFTGQDCQVDW